MSNKNNLADRLTDMELDLSLIDILLEDEAETYSEVQSVSLSNVDPTEFNENAAQNSCGLFEKMPKLERFSFSFCFEKVHKDINMLNTSIRNFPGVVLPTCPTLKSLTIKECFEQGWDEKTWDAFNAYIQGSNISNFGIFSRFVLDISDDRKKLETFFEHTISVQSFEIELSCFKDGNVDSLCDIVKEHPNISHLVLHLSNSKLHDLEKPGLDLLEIKHVNVVRIFEGEKEITPEKIKEKMQSKLDAKVKLITQGKGKTDIDGAINEIEQFISSLYTQHSSAKMLPCQIMALRDLYVYLDSMAQTESKHLNKFIFQLIHWFKSGVISASEHVEILNSENLPASFELYLRLLESMTTGMSGKEIKDRWGEAVSKHIKLRYEHLCEAEKLDLNEKTFKQFEVDLPSFRLLLEAPILKTILGDEQIAIMSSKCTQLQDLGFWKTEDVFESR